MAYTMVRNDASRYGAVMERRNMRGGGSLLAIGTIAGTIGGGLHGQPVVGLLSGLAIGTVIAVFIWLVDRRR